jgi:hypothetical protein
MQIGSFVAAMLLAWLLVIIGYQGAAGKVLAVVFVPGDLVVES